MRGRQEGAVRVWRGLPYAQAPVGDLRFRAPQPPLPWQQVREAAAFGAVAPQLPLGRAQSTSPAQPQAEDCLFLNVWAPAAPGTYPVMVWVHGGQFLGGSGSAPTYDGARFAAQGEVVVVTLNYRLGVLGFLHLGGLGPGFDNNLGLLDQVAALRWVQQNIAAFGGDPGRVTVFGESAGAMSIAALLGMPASVGLFQAAILESGAVQVQPATRAQRVAETLLHDLTLSDPAALRTLPVADLLQAGQRLGTAFPDGLALQPTLDAATLPQPPLAALAAGAWRGLPLLLGTNHDEGNFMVPPQATGQQVPPMLAAIAGPAVAPRLAPLYPTSQAGLSALITDSLFWLPVLQLAEQQTQHAPVWLYRFDWHSPSGQPIAGAYHTLELNFVWDVLDKSLAQAAVGPDAAPQALATAMHRAWLAFAHHHNPNGPGLPAWPRYEQPARGTLIFNTKIYLENDPYRAKRDLWASTALG